MIRSSSRGVVHSWRRDRDIDVDHPRRSLANWPLRQVYRAI
nr:hypothetical protein JVH1_9083 [Rhodococcus sp. JVH1]